jgi:hypothetical protein
MNLKHPYNTGYAETDLKSDSTPKSSSLGAPDLGYAEHCDHCNHQSPLHTCKAHNPTISLLAVALGLSQALQRLKKCCPTRHLI